MSQVKSSSSIKSFASLASARKWLHQLSTEFSLDPRLLGLDVFDLSSPPVVLTEHNLNVQRALAHVMGRESSYVIEGPGRNYEERGYVLVEQGTIAGYAFLPADNSDLQGIQFHLKPLAHSENSDSIVEGFNQNRMGYRRVELD
jgi:hypothetical protein